MTKVGIIGCGTILSVHLDAINDIDWIQIKTVCDIEEDLASKVANTLDCSWTTEYMDLLEDNEIEVVHILTPHYLHVPMAIEALNHGKHVVLEKPVGIDSKHLKELLKVAQATGLTVGVTLQNRFNPTTLKMKEIIESNRLGKFIGSKGILTWCREAEYYDNSKWRGRLETEGGGLLINQAIHTLDLMEYIGGEIASVSGTVMNLNHPNNDVEDTASLMFKYKSGATGVFMGSNNHKDNSTVELEFIFDKGSLKLEGRDLKLIMNSETEVIASDTPKGGQKSYWGTSHKLIINNIYESISNNTQPFVTLEDGIRATELVLSCYRID